ncbi:MAG: hypothetical protein MUE44_02025 [Oscillatoriaceae cyanobacterium Prado104]|jgi:hypothetical protein|nr:hypothetical protein [Oscillatoriaceae cyanobacterium Prado104]
MGGSHICRRKKEEGRRKKEKWKKKEKGRRKKEKWKNSLEVAIEKPAPYSKELVQELH